MDITHPGQQFILHFDVFVQDVLYIFHCSLHILELMLFHVFVYFALFGFDGLCLTNIILVLFLFVISLYVCVYMYMLKLLSCEFWWFTFIVYAHVRRHNFTFYSQPSYIYIFNFFGLKSILLARRGQ